MMEEKEVHILLVEDNDGDIVLAKEALKEALIRNRVTVLTDGEAALNYLFREGDFYDAGYPDIILLDMNLPKVNGIEVLAKIKADERLKIIPVVMLSTSLSEQHVRDAYRNYVNCYINKPIAFEKFIGVIRSIENFWLNGVILPSG